MPAKPDVIVPKWTHRSVLLERLIDFEIEAGGHFVIEMLPAGYSLGEKWAWLPRSAHESENGIILVSALVSPAPPEPRLALLPPFPIATEKESNSFNGLRAFLALPRAIGIILLRLGNYAVGIAENGKLVTTKTGSRYVKNQHRKGGQSSNRFRRGREKWIRELFDQVGEIASSRFSEYPGSLDFLALGGDRVVLGRFLKRVKLPDGLAERALPNRLPVSKPGRDALDSAVRDAWSLRVYEAPSNSNE